MSNKTSEKTGFATAALVLGIIGVVLSFIPIINNAAFVLGALALIFAIVALVKKKSVVMAIVSLIIAVTAMVITLAMQKSFSDTLNKATDEINKNADNASGNNTDEILKNDVSVTLGEFTITNGEYGVKSSKMTVSVTNKMAEKKSFSIKIEAVNTEGDRIAEDTIYANDLGAGQSQNFDVFTLVSGDKYDALKSANFKIVSVSKV